MFTDQQNAKCVLWYTFYEFAVAVRKKLKNFYHVHYHQTPGGNSILRSQQQVH
jgi:hypothetical protein